MRPLNNRNSSLKRFAWASDRCGQAWRKRMCPSLRLANWFRKSAGEPDGGGSPAFRPRVYTSSTGKAACNSHPATNQEWINSGCRLATLLPDCFLVSFRGEFFGHHFLELFSIRSVAFGGVHENVGAAGAGARGRFRRATEESGVRWLRNSSCVQRESYLRIVIELSYWQLAASHFSSQKCHF